MTNSVNDAEVWARAAEGPEELCVFGWGGGDDFALGCDEGDLEEVVNY